MSEEKKDFKIRVTRKENFQLEVDFGIAGTPILLVDEDPPIGEGAGPDPSRLLGAAVAQCLVSSLLFCLKKSRIEIGDIITDVTIRFGRNEQGRLRISELAISMQAESPEKNSSKLDRCIALFRDYCTVSESVRNGILINVDISTVFKEE